MKERTTQAAHSGTEAIRARAESGIAATRRIGTWSITCPSDFSPLPATERRNEVLTFPDGSELEINAQMRRDCGTVYDHACKKAVARRMVENASGQPRLAGEKSRALRREHRMEAGGR
jgi:hypothetical protein